ncbi:hybrid sensor histidine kinase/response regulator [Alcanivorax sp. N3-2A]|nr:hybrid sensor histidine kinase/response regulator [Alcanivorax sp. N3-2A]|tara:strand:+ start:29370 stop:32084 length:2715 start_codon:yes stop_codon:yes gene_type:complete
MARSSLRNRIMAMTALPAFLAAMIVGGYTLITRIQDVRENNAHRQQLIVDSFASRLQALGADQRAASEALLRELLEQPDVRAATLLDPAAGWQLHAGPRLRPVQEAQPLGNGGKRLRTDSSWQLVRTLPGAGQRLFTVEFARQGQYVQILEAVLTMVGVLALLMLLALVPAAHLSRQLTRPVRTMIESVRRVRDGDLSPPPATGAQGELRDLDDAIGHMVAALNDAQAELQQNVDQATQDLRETLETIEIQNIELDMARKEALKASQIKSEFLANMSHEIRTPLNGIIGFTRLLQRSELSNGQRDYLATIRKSAESLLSIINDILDFSKIEAGKLSLEHIPLDLHDIIEEVQTMLAPMAQERGLEQAAIIYTDVPTRLLGDPLRIRQVLTNLVSNAIKFTERGSVVVRAMLEESRGAESVIKITITDTGNGLPEDARKTLFSAFTQADQTPRRREGGTGLGLAISKRLVEGMGGEIGVDSSSGRGSTFWFSLRAERDPGTEAEAPPRALQTLRVTLVEANEHARLGLYHMLSGWRMRVSELQALDVLASQLQNGTPPRCDFYVLGVPASSRNPAHLAPLIRRLAASTGTPVLVLAGNGDPLGGSLSELEGTCRVLGKPATRRRLRDALLDLGQLETTAPTQTASATPYSSARVLVVDDHPGNLKLAQVFLEEMGVRVTPCASGAKAVEVFSPEHFDLVFMDVQMPGMDGLETTRRLRQSESGDTHTPIIALTAHALESERRTLLDSGMDDYLTKPITETQLRHTLERWVARGGAAITAPAPADTPSENSPAPDQVVDHALGRRRAGGREQLAQDMFAMLLSSLDQDAPGISALAEANDRGALLERVHRLHGATRYCGTPRLELAARALEEGLKKDVADSHLERLVATLLAEIESVRQAGQAQGV